MESRKVGGKTVSVVRICLNGREEMFCLLLPECGLATFLSLPKRTVSDQGHHILIRTALARLMS